MSRRMKGSVVFLALIMFISSFSSGNATFFEEGIEIFFIMPGDTNEDASLVYCGNAICDVGETDWGLVAKIDKRESVGLLRIESIKISLLILIGITIFISLFILILNRFVLGVRR